MENSERTRATALSYLNVWTIYFYPEHKEMGEILERLAYNLNGILKKPELSRNYELIRIMVGWHATKMAMRFIAIVKLWCCVYYDRVFSR
jgi:hypothetical protein